MKREAAACIILHRKGQSTNAIAAFLGRSRAVVHGILKQADVSSLSLFQDLRKMPARIKLLSAMRNRFFMAKTWAAWESWIFGEGEKPP